jgi:hypothetical protein
MLKMLSNGSQKGRRRLLVSSCVYFVIFGTFFF